MRCVWQLRRHDELARAASLAPPQRPLPPAAVSRELRHATHHEDAGACHHAYSANVMAHTPHTELLRYVRSHWSRLQGGLARRYYQRVTLPVRFWVACGRPPQFAPRLPWW